MKQSRIVRFKKTQDDWCPNYPNNEVKVVCSTNMEHEGKVWHRVSVWGDDDLGMEIDFFGKDGMKKAGDMFLKVIKLKFVNKNVLKQLGFVMA